MSFVRVLYNQNHGNGDTNDRKKAKRRSENELELGFGKPRAILKCDRECCTRVLCVGLRECLVGRECPLPACTGSRIITYFALARLWTVLVVGSSGQGNPTHSELV